MIDNGRLVIDEPGVIRHLGCDRSITDELCLTFRRFRFVHICNAPTRFVPLLQMLERLSIVLIDDRSVIGFGVVAGLKRFVSELMMKLAEHRNGKRTLFFFPFRLIMFRCCKERRGSVRVCAGRCGSVRVFTVFIVHTDFRCV